MRVSTQLKFKQQQRLTSVGKLLDNLRRSIFEARARTKVRQPRCKIGSIAQLRKMGISEVRGTRPSLLRSVQKSTGYEHGGLVRLSVERKLLTLPLEKISDVVLNNKKFSEVKLDSCRSSTKKILINLAKVYVVWDLFNRNLLSPAQNGDTSFLYAVELLKKEQGRLASLNRAEKSTSVAYARKSRCQAIKLVVETLEKLVAEVLKLANGLKLSPHSFFANIQGGAYDRIGI